MRASRMLAEAGCCKSRSVQIWIKRKKIVAVTRDGTLNLFKPSLGIAVAMRDSYASHNLQLSEADHSKPVLALESHYPSGTRSVRASVGEVAEDLAGHEPQCEQRQAPLTAPRGVDAATEWPRPVNEQTGASCQRLTGSGIFPGNVHHFLWCPSRGTG
jgi:hypothetical protein